MSPRPGTIRRNGDQSAPWIALSACTVDLERERVLRSDAVVPLTTRETCLLRYLWEREGRDVSREELLVEVWGYSPLARSRTVDATMRRLRSKLERNPAAPEHLLTVWGNGYRLVARELGATTTRDRLLGREAETRAVCSAFSAGARILTLIGPSGAGKTRLAQEVMTRLEYDARFCTVGEATDTTTLVRSIAIALDADPGAAAESVLSRLLAMRGDLVLVLDSVEHAITPAAQLVARLIAAAPRLRVLATSLEALGIAGEHVLELGPLPIDDAVTLLRERSSAPEWASSRALPVLAERLECMPLALELAAGLDVVLSPTDLLAHIDANLDVLVSRRRDVPDRHRSLRGAVAWSFELLDRADADALLTLAVFSGGFGIDAAMGVLGSHVDAVNVVARLRARSFLRPLPGGDGRLGLYDAVRAYALEALSATSKLGEARERHRAWYAEEARRRFPPTGHVARPEHVAFLAAEIDNFCAACRHSLPDHPEDAAALALAAYQVFHRRGPLQLGIELFDACLEFPLPDALRGHVLRMRGTGALALGRGDQALADARAAISIARHGGDPLLEGRAQGLLGLVEYDRGDIAAALSVYERAIALTRKAGDRAYEASARGNYASSLASAGRIEEAALQCQRALSLHRELGNVRNAAIILSNMGLYDVDSRRLERARARLTQALDEERRLGDRLQEGVTLGQMARLELVAGDFPQASEYAEHALAMLTAVGEREHVGHHRLLVAIIAWAQRDRCGARAALEQACATRTFHYSAQDTVLLLDLLLRVDEGEIGDPWEALTSLPEPPSAVRRRAVWLLAEGFLAAAGGARTRDPVLRDRARAALGCVTDRALAGTVEPWRTELARRVEALD
jgi:predicted ATPase/DNA-binding winged helix-turn-helix (wHTH) protein/Tfp pilus assembly protein PilF